MTPQTPNQKTAYLLSWDGWFLTNHGDYTCNQYRARIFMTCRAAKSVQKTLAQRNAYIVPITLTFNN